MSRVKSILRTLYSGPNISMKLLIMLGEDKGKNGYSKKPFKKWINTITDDASISYEFLPFIQFDFNKQYSPTGTYNNTNKVHVPIYQIYKLLHLFSQIVICLDKDDLYYIDDKYNGPNDTAINYNMYADAAAKYHVYDDGFIGQRTLHLFPSIISDGIDQFHKGVQISVNDGTIGTVISLPELYSIIYLLQKTDFINLSESMVTTSVLVLNGRNLYVTETSNNTYHGIPQPLNQPMYSQSYDDGNTNTMQGMRNEFQGLKGQVE